MPKLKPINSLQLRAGIASGGATATDLTVTATDGSTIATADTLIAVWHISTAAAIATKADVTSEASIVTAGSIQLSTTTTTDDQLEVWWHDADVAP
jgi:hypothetical protein